MFFSKALAKAAVFGLSAKVTTRKLKYSGILENNEKKKKVEMKTPN
jgi:hypothetical protein